MDGTVAITDQGWYDFLLSQSNLDEVNFWTPSAHWGFRADVGSPFFFKLKARYGHAVCGFAYFARFARLPDWLAWESFDIKNGRPTLVAMRDRIAGIRAWIDYRAPQPSNEVGCILLAEPTFFRHDAWIRGPSDWPPANLRHKKYDLTRVFAGVCCHPRAFAARVGGLPHPTVRERRSTRGPKRHTPAGGSSPPLRSGICDDYDRPPI